MDKINAFILENSMGEIDTTISEYIFNLIEQNSDDDLSFVVDIIHSFLPTAPLDRIRSFVSQYDDKAASKDKEEPTKIILTNDSGIMNSLQSDPLSFLTELVPASISSNYIRYVLNEKYHNNQEEAAQFLVETPIEQLEQYEYQYTTTKKETIDKERILIRYDEQPIGTTTSAHPVKVRTKTKVKKDESSKIRYYNNQIVSRKGDRYVPEAPKEEWDGGSRGRVKSKGKRGKGWQ